MYSGLSESFEVFYLKNAIRKEMLSEVVGQY